MQFRPQGNRIQVLAYRGYDKEKKRAQVKLLGSFDKHGYSVSDGLINKLTDDEKTELQSHMESIRQSNNAVMREYSIKGLARLIDNVSDSLTDEQFVSLTDQQYANEVYEAIDGLTKRLRKLGFRRAVKPPAEDVNAHGAGDMETDNLL